ncbi:oocyte zinc finger protein XlCOF6 [Anastrepha ludens]|uniref:oocyte zinc finger protein XlCOF6 n=1 Tax=Anastrepha ludens TaxID=28586 RepID=UPI0023AF3325|nr:oocyte zinc finger protein XlCOF6 [Anastrepha ludens]
MAEEMPENTSEDEQFSDAPESIESDDEALPNFAFPNLKDDPDLLYEFNTEDDNADSLREYLDEAVASNFNTLEFKWNSECLICCEQFEEYQDLLQHCIMFHENEFNEYACTLQDCDVVFRSEYSLARHLVLRHSDLQSIKIYGSCPYCDLRFSNFHQLNKHSCYRKLTRRACTQPYCQYCKQEFVSHKRFVFHLQFHLAKRRSKICLICNKDFTNVDEFFVHVNYEHEPPGTLACTICDRIFAEMEPFVKHQNSHKIKPKYECDECLRTYRNKKLLQAHKEGVHTNIEYKCDLCPKIFPSLAILQNHLKWHESDAEVRVFTCTSCGLIGSDCDSLEKHTSDLSTDCFYGEIEEEILIVAYSCHFCAQDFKDKDSLRKHRATGVHENEMFYCPLCNEELEDHKAKRTHMATHKNYKSWLESLPLKRLLMCDVGDCDECYKQWTPLQRHKRHAHKSNTCRICDQKFANSNELQEHIAQCQLTALTCQFCEKVCPTKMSLAVHVARRHNNKNVFCPHCAAAYRDEQALQEHIDYVHVPVPCTLCGKVIKCRRYLEVHMRAIHVSECRYFCTHCNKGFYHRSQKELHEENVHPAAVYKCGECKFTTNYAKSLDIHIARHLEISEFNCPHCPKKFGRKSALNMHIRRHKADKPFRCSDTIVDGCDAAYVTQHLLNNHIKRKHSLHSQQTKANSVTSQQKKSTAASIRKSKSKTKSKTETETVKNKSNSTAKEIKCENVNANNDITLSNTGAVDILFEAEESSIAAVELPGENSFMAAEVLPSGNNETYMLVVVDDETMEMVNNSSGELILLENVEYPTS